MGGAAPAASEPSVKRQKLGAGGASASNLSTLSAKGGFCTGVWAGRGFKPRWQDVGVADHSESVWGVWAARGAKARWLDVGLLLSGVVLAGGIADMVLLRPCCCATVSPASDNCVWGQRSLVQCESHHLLRQGSKRKLGRGRVLRGSQPKVVP